MQQVYFDGLQSNSPWIGDASDHYAFFFHFNSSMLRRDLYFRSRSGARMPIA
jgi:hypothetical protein